MMWWSWLAACTSQGDDPKDGDVLDTGIVDTDTDTTVITDARPLSELGPGDLLITEVMNKPSAAEDAYGEWIEIYNATAEAVDLHGLVLTAAIEDLSFEVDIPLPVPARGYVVLLRDADRVVNGDLEGQFDYRSDLPLDNDAETLILSLGATTFDTVAYDDRQFFPDVTGASLALDPGHLDAASNDEGQYWCPGTATYGAGDLATPGAPNDPCPRLDDGDGDGWVAAHDCDDSTASIHPRAAETPRDDIDSDCDGADGHAADLTPGDLVITEIMNNPLAVSDSNGEWFEVLNDTPYSFELSGLEIRDDTGLESFVVDTPVVAPAHGYLVFVADPDEADNGGVTQVDYDYPGGSFGLGNSADAIVLIAGGETIEAVAWDGGIAFPDPTGASMTLAPNRTTATANDQGASWCMSSSPITETVGADLGTPGAANDACP